MSALLAVLCFVWTIVAYYVCKRFYQRFPRIWMAPGIAVPTITICLLLLTHVSYDTYMSDSQWILWMLGPTTVAFAVPIYEFRHTVRAHALALTCGVCAGMVVSMVSALALSRLMHFDPILTRSLMARSISTPFAMALASHNGGSPELVSVFTIITGVVGIVAGDAVLAVLRLRSNVAQGASFGASAHGFGTARARERNTEEGVIASLTMVLAGILMVVVGPSLTNLLNQWI